MEVITPNYMQQPNLCLMCENTPEAGTNVVDTLRNLSIGGAPSNDLDQPALDLTTHLSGRKYICEACVYDLARTLGWTTPEDVETLVSELSEISAELGITKLRTEPAVQLAKALASYTRSQQPSSDTPNQSWPTTEAPSSSTDSSEPEPLPPKSPLALMPPENTNGT